MTTRVGKWAARSNGGRRKIGRRFLSFFAVKGAIRLMLSFLDPVCQEPRILWGEFVPDPWHFYFRTQRLRVKSPSIHPSQLVLW